MNLEKLKEEIQAARVQAMKDPMAAYDTAEEAYRVAKIHNLVPEEAAALFVKALACRSMSKLDLCYQNAMDALTLYEGLADDLGMATALNLIGVVFFYYGKMETAMTYFLKALHHLEFSAEPITESRIWNNLGEIYKESGDYKAALEAYHKALALCSALDMKPNTAVILENIGEVYFRQQEVDLSYDYFSKSFDMLIELQDATALSEVENKLGLMLYLKGHGSEAKVRCENALKRLEDIGNKFYAIEVLMTLAEIKQNEGSPDFLEDLSRAAFYAEVLNASKPLKKVYRWFADFYEGQGQFEQALYYFKKYHNIELEIESTLVSRKLEIIKIELNKAFEGDTVERVKSLNKQLEGEIEDQAALLSQLQQANKQLDQAVSMDELTKVLNRRGFGNKMNQIWEEPSGSATPLALLMMDLDHFKAFNDTYGHVQGDRCLEQVAAVMSACLKEYDAHLGRYGGEEFVAALIGVSEADAVLIAEQLRMAIERTPVQLAQPNRAVRVTISIGVAAGFKHHWKGMQDLYTKADEALYQAKADGRNRVSVFKNTQRLS